MNNSRNKTTATLIALFLMLTIAVTMVALPTANAHTPPWTITTLSYITASPNPVGVNQKTTLAFWVNWVPPGAGGQGGDRWRNLSVEVTKPDSSKETLGPFTSDPIGGGYTVYTPDQVGNYTFKFNFPGQVPSMYGPTGVISVNPSNWAYINDTFLPSSATTTITVQQEPITALSFPLPTEYWTRPIEGQNTAWYTIASNWLGSPQIVGNVQPDGTAPGSAHVMWTRPIQFGGVVGGSNTRLEGATFYDGTAYQGKFTNPIIIYGRLYYQLPESDIAAGGFGSTGTEPGGYACVDLRTGEQIYWQNMTAPSFGQLYYYDSLNQHGVIPNGYLWRTIGTNWTAYNPLNGDWLFTLTGVPSGTSVYGPNGEILRYVFNYNSTRRSGWLALWNNTAEQQGLQAEKGYGTNAYQWRPVGKTVNMSNAYSWNVTITADLTGLSTPSIVQVFYDDLILGRSTSFAGIGVYGTPDPWTYWAISLKPNSRGQLLWIKNYPAPAGNLTLAPMAVDPETRVFTMFYRDSLALQGYSLDDGSLLWTTQPEDPWSFYAHTSVAAEGKLFSSGYGIVYCYDLKTGKLLWKFNVPSGLESPYPNYPFSVDTVCDGKAYVGIIEHSASAPYWKGAKEYCLNASTGEVIWKIASHGASTAGGLGAITTGFALADGYFVYLNLYDMQVYCIGKGPSATEVGAAPKVSVHGNSVLIEGSVTDIAAGTKQNEQAARFPNGVPAMADAIMGEWMEYVYMQKPCPTNPKGVEVSLDTLDPNGNFVHIGTVTSDASGMFKKAFVPEVPGEYTIIATFTGSESYYGSYAETFINVDEAPPATAPPEYPQPIDYTMHFVFAVIAIIIAVALAAIWIRRK